MTLYAQPTTPRPDPDSPEPGPDKVRTRPDVWKLAEWDDTLLWYARAIAEMQKRPIADPTSWRFQAAIHAYDRNTDPYADPSDQLLGATDQARFWNQCQHGNWYFLPWHRMYLGYFEQIVAATVEQLGGPVGWSLPYWNYSDTSNPDARKLPPAFRAEQLPDGSPNPLRVEERVPAANAGDIVAEELDVDIVDCLDETVFAGAAFSANSGFGGTQISFNHSGGDPGKVEITPHGNVHMSVGGWFPLPPGFMSGFATAGLDPLFWLHHANIDRLWTVWNKRNLSHTNPAQSQWLNAPDFEFHDASGARASLTSASVVDTTTSPFSYRYEDESDPLGSPVGEVTEAEEEAFFMDEHPAEMIGATESGTTLAGEMVTTRVVLQPPTGPALETEAEVAPGRIHLNLENVTGREPVPHLVYINLPEGAEPSDHPERLAGSLPMFGLPEASGANAAHPGSGLRYALDITPVVERLGDEWSFDEMRVTLVPRVPPGQEAAGEIAEIESEPPQIEIGRISLYLGQ